MRWCFHHYEFGQVIVEGLLLWIQGIVVFWPPFVWCESIYSVFFLLDVMCRIKVEPSILQHTPSRSNEVIAQLKHIPQALIRQQVAV